MSSVKHRLIKGADQSTGKLHSPTVLQAIDLGLTTSVLVHRHPSFPRNPMLQSQPRSAFPAAAQPMPIRLSFGKAFFPTAAQLYGDI